MKKMNHSYDIHRQLFAVLKEYGLVDSRHELVYNFTNGRFRSTKDLNENEVKELIYKIKGQLPPEELYTSFAMFNNENKQHRYLLSMCIQYGRTVYCNKRGRMIADLAWLGGWIAKRTKAKKPLLKMSVREVQDTIYAFEQMLVKETAAELEFEI